MIRVTSQTQDGPRDFVAVIVPAGIQSVGRERCPIDPTNDTVEFYDATYAGRDGFATVGQFVSCYWLETIVDVQGGLCLDGGNASYWTISAGAMAQVVAFLKGFQAGRA
jgi:hypothetical protein